MPKSRLCSECGHWQFPFGCIIPHLSLGDLTLYGAVLVLLYVTFRSIVFGDAADLSAKPLKCGNWEVELLITNSGTARGIMAEPKLVVELDEGTRREFEALMSEPSGTGSSLVLDPTESSSPSAPSRLLSLMIQEKDRSKFAALANQNQDCTVSAEFDRYLTNDADSESDHVDVCDCVEFLR